MMYIPQKKIKDEKLLRTYRGMACCLCGSRHNVAGHHVMKRSKLRLDVPYNLYPVCGLDHTLLEHHKEQFIEKWGQKEHDRLTNWKQIMQIYEQERAYK